MASVQVENLPRKLILKRYSVTYGKGTSGNNQPLAGGASRRWSPANIGYTFPEGYVPVGITYFGSGSSYTALSYLELQNDTSTSYNTLAVRNLTSSSSVAYGNTVTFDVLFAPGWMIETISDDETSQPQSNIIKEPIFKRKRFTYAYGSIAASSRKAFTAANFSFSVPDGYEIFSIYDISSGNMNVSLCDFDPFSSTRFLTVNNAYTSSVSITPALGVTFINKKYKEFGIRYMVDVEVDDPTISVSSLPEFGQQLFDGENVDVIVNNPSPSNYDYHMSITGLEENPIIYDGAGYSFTMPENDVLINVYKTAYGPFCYSRENISMGKLAALTSHTAREVTSYDMDPPYYVPSGYNPIVQGFRIGSNGATSPYKFVFAAYTPEKLSASVYCNIYNPTSSTTSSTPSLPIKFNNVFIDSNEIDDQRM